MNYDKMSFLAGLRAAMSLGRTPGRMPPPTSVYILAEDGTPIITEISPYDVTNFAGGEWIAYAQHSGQGADTPIVDTFTGRLMRTNGDTPNYFVWFIDNSWAGLVLWAEEPTYLDSSAFAIQRLNTDGTITNLVNFGTSSSSAHRAGNLWYVWYGPSLYRPQDFVAFSGTLEELESYLAALSGRYMITE